MTEPTLAATIAAAFSTTTLALFGVDYYALLWGFIGALIALSQADAMPRNKAATFVTLSTFAGAAIGGVMVWLLPASPPSVQIFTSMVGGFGSQLIVKAAMDGIARALGGLNGGAK